VNLLPIQFFIIHSYFLIELSPSRLSRSYLWYHKFKTSSPNLWNPHR